MKSYHITTFGCQMNHSDSERLATILGQNNLCPAPHYKDADLAILNTCSVRQKAVDRVHGLMKEFRAIKNHHPEFKIIITGCVANHQQVEKEIPGADLYLDIKELKKLPAVLETWKKKLTRKDSQKIAKNQRRINLLEYQTNSYFTIKPNYQSSYRAYVPIMTGCNHFCSYCIVPMVRGREVSRPQKDILAEISTLLKKGYKEIILLGQNVNSYNNPEKQRPGVGPGAVPKRVQQSGDLSEPGVDFVDLLKNIDAMPGEFWLNFTTSHPVNMSDSLIAFYKTSTHLTPYLNLPVQSGSNKILAAMRREYTIEHYMDRLQKTRQARPEMAISTDIIVGFPGETVADFTASKKIARQGKFTQGFISEYSPRPMTLGVRLDDSVTKTIKKKRKVALNDIITKNSLRFNRSLVGSTYQCLVEVVTKNKAIAKMPFWKNVRFTPTANTKSGTFVNITITKARQWELEGKPA